MKASVKMLVAVFSIAILASILAPVSANGGSHDYKSALWAGRDHTEVGLVTVDWMDEDTLRITYETYGCCKLVETHLIVAEELEDIPQTNSGNPKIGHFPYAEEHCPPVNEYTYYVDVTSEGPFVIAAHAVVCCGCKCETAWAQGSGVQDFPGNNWAVYFDFDVTPP